MIKKHLQIIFRNFLFQLSSEFYSTDFSRDSSQFSKPNNIPFEGGCVRRANPDRNLDELLQIRWITVCHVNIDPGILGPCRYNLNSKVVDARGFDPRSPSPFRYVTKVRYIFNHVPRNSYLVFAIPLN